MKISILIGVGQLCRRSFDVTVLLLSAAVLLICTEIQPSAANTSCEDVRYNCAFGESCSKAMQNYFILCDKLLTADPTTCPDICLYALVALTSTKDGKRLMDCTCRDEACEKIKSKVEVCRPLVVEAAKNETVVPCEMAQWVCMVDPVCSLAFGYYHTYCKRMIKGTTCTERCLNSAEILWRQEKAFMMNRCRCTGKSAGDCLRNKERMVRLCFGGGPADSGGDARVQQGGGGGGRKNRKKHRPRMFDSDPDRAEVELMLADPDYEPDVRHRYNGMTVAGGEGKGSAVAVRAPSLAAAVLYAVVTFLTATRWSTRQ